MGKTVVADTGAILSLELSGLLDACRKHFKIIFGNKVAEELKEIASREDELAKAAHKILRTNEIVDAGVNFSKGEDECLKLLEESGADFLISDDIEFARKHKKNRKIIFSVVLLGILLEKGIITKAEFLNSIESIFEKRKWENNILYLIAQNIVEEYGS